MSATVYDDFIIPQLPGSFLASNNLTNWTPVPSNRVTYDQNGIDIYDSSISGGSLVFDIIQIGGDIFTAPFLSYNYDENGGTSQDFSNLGIITLTKDPNSIFPESLQLALSSNLITQYLEPDSIVGDVATWTVANFNQVDLTDITNLDLVVFDLTTVTLGTYTFIGLNSILLCLAANTQILLANGETKPIFAIQRGDMIPCSAESGAKCYPVAQVLSTKLNASHPVDLLKLERNALGHNLPYEPLYISKNHPILYRGGRRPAYCFKKLDGATYYEKTPFGEIINGAQYDLYDLQFEVDTSYVANGVTVQSRSPYSDITPLPKELYFDQSLYKKEVVWDSLNHNLPLITEYL